MTSDRSCEARLALAREYLASQFEAYEHAGACFVITPFLRHDNDPVVLRIDEESDGHLIVTDGGETIDYLRLSGFSVRRNAPFQKQLNAIGQSFGVHVEDEEILLETDEGSFAEALAAVARAAQHTSYLIYRRRERGTVRFEERVEVELISVGAHYERDSTIRGRTGLRRFSFHVNGSTNALLQPLTGTSRDALTSKAERLVFRIIDVQQAAQAADNATLVARPEYRFYPVLDDTGRAADLWDPRMIETLTTYSDGVIRWSSDRLRAELATAVGVGAPP